MVSHHSHPFLSKPKSSKMCLSFPAADAQKRELPSITGPNMAERKSREFLGEESLDSPGEERTWQQRAATTRTARAAVEDFMLFGGEKL